MNFTEVERHALSLLTDAHAHPTDDPRLSSRPSTSDSNDAGDTASFEDMADRLVAVPLGGICAMSSCTQDQGLVKLLAAAVGKVQRQGKGKAKEVEGGQSPPRVIPCFGYHPWYSHTISLQDPPLSHAEHYRSLLLASSSPGSKDKAEQSRQQLESLIPHLPPPRSLKEVLDELRSNLIEHPDALLGEVGLDRAFKLPTSRDSVNDQPSEANLLASESQDSASSERADTSAPSNQHTLALRGKKLTSLAVPIEHQVQVLLAQIGVAVQLGRSVSMHSVRAGEATVELLKECCRRYNGADGKGFRDINLDLHSCTLSPEVIKGILRIHTNVFVSFSTTINSRQKNLDGQLDVVPPTRLLLESDWHSAEDLAARNLEILRTAVPYLVRGRDVLKLKIPEGQESHIEAEKINRLAEGDKVAEELLVAARIVRRNWQRFETNIAKRKTLANDDAAGEAAHDGGDTWRMGDGDDDDDDDEEDEAIDAFEQEWWKAAKTGKARSSS